jgi:tripartite-type tricarboxylate transporter receptor subunit TctC
MRRIQAVAAIAIFCINFAAPAQDYPARPIRIVSPFGSGTAGDVLGRVTAAKLAQRLGQNVVVENRPGGSGVTGARHVAESAADGYTLLLGGGPLTLNQALNPDLTLKVETDLAPIASFARTKILMFTANNDRSPKTFAELMERLRAKPMPFGSVGPVTMGRLTTEVVLHRAGVSGAHVPYKGSSESLVAVIRGDVLFASDAVAPPLPQIRAGALRPLVVASSERLATLPEVPTLAEVGIPGVDINVWYGLFAPPKTAPAVIKRIADELAANNQDADYRNRLRDMQFEIFDSPGGDFRGFIVKELAFWQQFFQSSKLKLDN